MEQPEPVSPPRDPRGLAGDFGVFVGTLSTAEAAEMQTTLDDAFGTIRDDW